MIRDWLAEMLMKSPVCPVRVFKALDGMQALEICASTTLDLVITDIRMPNMDGIHLLLRLRETHPNIHVAALSAYDDFQYVRKALQCGAMDYIPKADFSQADIDALLQNVLSSMSLDYGMHTERQEHVLREAALMLRQNQFAAYLEGRLSETDFLASLNLYRQKAAIVPTAFTVRAQEKKQLMPRYRILQIVQDVLAGQGLTGGGVVLPSGYLLLYQTQRGGAAKEVYLRLFAQLDHAMHTHLGLEVQYSVSYPWKTDRALTEICEKLDDALTFNRYYNGKQVEQNMLSPEQRSKNQAEMIRYLQYLLEDDLAGALNLLKKYMTDTHRECWPPRDILDSLRLASRLLRTRILLISPKQVYEPTLQAMDEELEQLATMEETDTWCERYCSLCLELAGALQRQVSPVILEAARYMDKHTGEKLSLEDVARHVSRNKTYLSQLFHQELGISFSKYLETLRISKALNLLVNTDRPLSQVAKDAGFSSTNYFAKVFHRITGESPSCYRRQRK